MKYGSTHTGILHARELVTGLALGLLVVLRAQSLPAAVAATAVAVVAAKRPATKVCIATLGFLTCVGVPWIASPLIAGIVWLLVSRGRGSWAWVCSSSRRLWGVGGLVCLGIGLVAGLVAIPTSQDQAWITPVVFDIVQPPTPVIVVALIVLAGANAVGEELIWRGALLEDDDRLPVTAQYILQLLSFGMAHWYGLPGGFAGCLLTGIASILFLFLHHRWGISASILAHFVADIVIFAAISPQVIFTGWSF